ILLAGAVAVCGWPYLALLPALARNWLGSQERGYSAMLSGMGVGALTAALTVATFGTPERQQGFLATGVGAVVAGLVGLSLVRQVPPAVVSCGFVGLGLILFLTTCQSIVQLSVSDEQRGRVMGIWAMVWSGAPPLGSLLVGPAADGWGEPVVLRTQGIVLALAAVSLLALSRWWMDRTAEARI